MEKEYKLGKFVGLDLSVVPSFFVGTILLWIILGGAGVWLFQWSISRAIWGGLVAVLLYWFADIIHHLGHSYAARQTGYPMVGARLGTRFFFATSVYPVDEEPLPANIHIRRALGGPIGSLLFTVVTGVIAWLLYPIGGFIWQITLFICLLNFVMFTLGAFLPLGFTDGSTILEWRNKR